ncbi:hypothetical protein I7I48_10213 [Histoplasma ohiense]|nr:hypothetical protein I7I48_10213 [Histoplasma ohiense (nom. inval.)]
MIWTPRAGIGLPLQFQESNVCSVQQSLDEPDHQEDYKKGLYRISGYL